MSEERSFAAVLRDIVQSVAEIIRSEIRLAKTEMLDEARTAVGSVKWIAGGSVLAFLASMCMVGSAVFALALVMPLWAAALVVAVAVGVVGSVMIVTGLRRLRQVRVLPQRTVSTLMENAAWIKHSHR